LVRVIPHAAGARVPHLARVLPNRRYVVRMTSGSHPPNEERSSSSTMSGRSLDLSRILPNVQVPVDPRTMEPLPAHE